MSFSEYFQAFAGLGDSYRRGVADYDRKQVLAKLGEQFQGGDYKGAAGTLFGAGDVDAGMNLLKFNDVQQQRKLTADADANFLQNFGGFGVGGVTGGSDGTRQPAVGAGGNIQPFKTNDPVAEDLPAHQRALLNGIAGPESAGKYNIRFTPRGGALFEGFDRHPGIAEMGPAGPSTAAGRYQFTKTTWDGMGGGDFSPANQDRRAVQLAQQDYRTRTGRDLDADLQAEGFSPRIQKVLAPTWVGLGGNQQRNAATYAESLARYNAGGQPPQVAGTDPGRSPQAGLSGLAPQRVASADPGFAPQAPLSGLPPGASGLNPGRPVQVADDENQTQVLEGRMGMYPPSVYGVAQPPRVASADPRAAFGAMPQGLSSAGDVRGRMPTPSDPGASPQRAPSPPLMPSSSNPTGPVPVSGYGGAPPAGRAMSMPGDAPAQAPMQVAQTDASPAAPADRAYQARLDALAQSPLGQRIPMLMRAIANPNLSDGPRQVAQTMLKSALDETRMPDGVKEFMWARANGMTRAANPGEYAREKQRDPGQDLDAQIQARAAAAQRYGMQPGTPEFQSYVLNNKPAPERQTEGEKITGAFNAREALAERLGYEKGSPAYNAYVGGGKTGAARDLTAGEKKSIETADTMALGAQQSIDMLQQAKELSAKAYAGPKAALRGQVAGYLGYEAGQATTELDNLVTTNALSQLKSIFGAAPTEGERKILLDIQGSSNLPHPLRLKIYDRAIAAAEMRRDQNQGKADAIREGRYFRQGGGATVRGNPVGSEDPGGQRAPAGAPPAPRPGMMSPGDRFGQLVGSGMSKAQAYQQLHSEGY